MAKKKYVNLNGLSVFFDNLKTLFATKGEVPTKLGDLENDRGYIIVESDPSVPSWAKEPVKPVYTASEVGADKQGAASTAVAEHNTDSLAHNDIRRLITDLANRLNILADCDDDTLDQMSEVAAYIKNNRDLIEGITTNKVSVSDVIDNLATNDSSKPLSAAQGVILKSLIDTSVAPTKLSDLINDKGFITSIPSEYITEDELLSMGYATTSQIPTSLPADGGNADTLDGYHIRLASEGDTGLSGYITFIV